MLVSRDHTTLISIASLLFRCTLSLCRIGVHTPSLPLPGSALARYEPHDRLCVRFPQHQREYVRVGAEICRRRRSPPDPAEAAAAARRRCWMLLLLLEEQVQASGSARGYKATQAGRRSAPCGRPHELVETLNCNRFIDKVRGILPQIRVCSVRRTLNFIAILIWKFGR